MKFFLDNFKDQSEENSRLFVSDNVNSFVDALMEDRNSKNFDENVKYFLEKIKPEVNSNDVLKEINSLNYADISEKKHVIKVILFSHLVDDKKQQQNFAAKQVSDYCQFHTKNVKKFGSENIEELGENISQILSPLAKDDKKVQKAIEDTSNIIAREAVSIISEHNPEVQLKGWQKFALNIVDKLKGIFRNSKFQEIIKSDIFNDLKETLNVNKRISTLFTDIPKTSVPKDQKELRKSR